MRASRPLSQFSRLICLFTIETLMHKRRYAPPPPPTNTVFINLEFRKSSQRSLKAPSSEATSDDDDGCCRRLPFNFQRAASKNQQATGSWRVTRASPASETLFCYNWAKNIQAGWEGFLRRSRNRKWEQIELNSGPKPPIGLSNLVSVV